MNGRILFITHQLSRTGAPIVLLDMIKLLLNNGYEADVISMEEGPLSEELKNINVSVEIQSRFYNKRNEFKKKAAGYDLVIANTLITYEVIHVLNKTDIPVIWWLHEGEQYFEYFKTVLPDFSDMGSNIKVYAVGHYVQDVIKRRYGVTVDIMHFSIDDVGNNAKHSVKKDNKIHFLTAGTYSGVKAQDVLIKSIEIMPEEYRERAEFCFCGNESMVDENVFNMVSMAEKKYSCVKILHQLSREETIEHMIDSDCLVVPSRIDPIPTVAVEAMMVRCACLCTSICGVAHYIEDGVNGFTVQENNPWKLAEKLMYIIDNPEKLALTGEAGREIYDRHFARNVVEPQMLYNVRKAIDNMNKKRIILFEGAYQTLDLFTEELRKGFNNLGYEIMVYNTKDTYESMKKLAVFINKKVNAVISFNNLGFNMELVPGKNIWDELGIPFVNILVGHPFCYQNALDNAPRYCAVLCIDRKHVEYIKRFHPNITLIAYLSHGGIDLHKEIKPIAERSIDVMYAGNLSRAFASNIMPDFNKYKEFDAKTMCQEIYTFAIENTDKTIDEVIEIVLNNNGIYLPDEELKCIISDLHFIELYVVSYYREKCVRTIAEAGVDVTLYGSGWDICEWINLPNVDYRGKVPPMEIVQVMSEAKIVLNTFTWFKDGAHERIFNGMLQGAAVVTDESKYILEEFSPDELYTFKLEEIDRLGIKVKQMLDDIQGLQNMADAGRNKAVNNHTWINKAEELDRDLISQL